MCDKPPSTSRACTKMYLAANGQSSRSILLDWNRGDALFCAVQDPYRRSIRISVKKNGNNGTIVILLETDDKLGKRASVFLTVQGQYASSDRK